jgi:single-stranded DNA-binding protein
MGMRVLVAGKLVQRTWQDNDGCSTLDRFLRTAISGGGSGFARKDRIVKKLPLKLGSAGRRCSRRQEDRRRSVPNKRQTVEIQVTHVGPDLQFATAEVELLQSPDKSFGVADHGSDTFARGQRTSQVLIPTFVALG